MSDWVRLALALIYALLGQPALLVLSLISCCLAVSSWWFWRQARKLAGERADLERNNEALGQMFRDGWQLPDETHERAEAELKQQNEDLRRELSWLRDNALEERTAIIDALHSWRELMNAELEQTGHATQRRASVAAVGSAHVTDGERPT